MKRYLYILFWVLFLSIGCKSAPEPRSTVSASGDPEDIFFEKNKVDHSIAQSIKQDLNPSTVTRYDLKDSDLGDFDEIGYSSWYGSQYKGRPTASGEPFDPNKLTAAHKTLPLGSVVRVQNLENNKEAVVRINDRGPFVEGRILDVSEKAADILDFKQKGVTKVGLKVIKTGSQNQFEDLDDGEDEWDTIEEPKKEKLEPKKPQEPNAAPVNMNRPRGFTVQVGLFRELPRAERYKALMAKEYNEKVFLYQRQDGYVVQVGDFATREEAEKLKAKMRYDGLDCFIPPR